MLRAAWLLWELLAQLSPQSELKGAWGGEELPQGHRGAPAAPLTRSPSPR